MITLIINLPAKYRSPFQSGGKPIDESFKTIGELHDFDRRKKMNKKFNRIRLD